MECSSDIEQLSPYDYSGGIRNCETEGLDDSVERGHKGIFSARRGQWSVFSAEPYRRLLV